MQINDKQYNFVSEKTVDGKTYTLLRSDENPKELVIWDGEKATPFKGNWKLWQPES